MKGVSGDSTVKSKETNAPRLSGSVTDNDVEFLPARQAKATKQSQLQVVMNDVISID